MKKINIQITKARIKSFGVDLDEDTPRVSATIGLYTEGGREITSYSVSSNSWDEDKKFDVPIEMISPILDIAKSLEVVLVKHCKDQCKLLETKTI